MIAAAQPVYSLPPDKLAKAIALSHWSTALYFGGVGWTVLALWLLLRLGAAARLRGIAQRLTPRPWLQGVAVTPVWCALLVLIGLPEDVLGEWVQRRYGLSVQPWVSGGASWLADFGKSAGISIVVGAVVLSVVYALMRRDAAKWWLWLWILTLPVEVAVVFVVPVVIDPLFDQFQPLAKADPALVVQLERVADKGGLHIPPGRMFVMNASAKSTGINAYVTGFGASKRIVVWDNTIREVPTDEILYIYGHEQGHYALHHIVKGLAYTALLTFAGFWLAARLLRWLVRVRGKRWGIQSIDDWGSVGALLLVVTVLGFFAEPAGNAFSRWEEHQADVYGQEVIHGLVPNPQATAVRSFERLGEVWLENPYPNPFVVFWTYSHPSTMQRAEFAAHYDPWQPGATPRYFLK